MSERIVEGLPKRPSGYSQAQKWYEKLKESFVQQIQKNLENSQQQGEIQNQIQKIENIIIEAKASNDNNKISEILTTIMRDFFDSIINNNTEVKDIKEIALANLKRKWRKEELHAVERHQREFILEKIHKVYSIEELRNLLINSINKVMSISNEEVKWRFGGLITRIDTILQRKIAQELNNQSMSYFQNFIMLRGYIQEDLEFQALLKALENFNIKVLPGGAKSVDGTETHMDIILSNINETLAEFEKNFNTQITTTRNVDLFTIKEQNELLKKIRYFGEQSKTFSLLAKKRVTGNIQGLRISNQSQMFDEYTKKKNYNDLISNINFVGQYKNILRSFGADTLLFATKDGRYFMSDFIDEIKKQHYYLLFGRNIKENELSSIVVIDKPWYSRVKIDKKTKNKQTSWYRYASYQNT